MHRLIPIFVIMALLISLTGIANATTTPVRVFVDGTEVQFPDQQPMINADSRTLVPVRFVSEALGAEVGWDGPNQQVSVKQNSKNIFLCIGQKQARVDEGEVILDTAACLVNSRTMVPLRFVSECLAAIVAWEQVGSASMINIFTKGQTAEEQQKIIAGSKNVIESGYMGEFWGYDNPSGKMPDAAQHDAQVASDKASVTSDLRIVSPEGNHNIYGLDLDMQIRMWLPLEPQYADAERLLASRLGTDAQQVIDYAKTKTSRDVWLEKKTWNFDGRSVQVFQGPATNGIALRVYYAH